MIGRSPVSRYCRGRRTELSVVDTTSRLTGASSASTTAQTAFAHGASVMTVTGIPTFARPARKPEGLLQLEKNATNLHVLILFDGGKGGLGYSRNLRLG